MVTRRRMGGFVVALVAAAFLVVQPASARKADKQDQKKAQREAVSGVVSSVEQSNGMITIRLDNGKTFSAPAKRVSVRDFRSSALAKAGQAAGDAKTARQPRFVVSSVDAVTSGSRVIVREKLGKDGNLKRVVVRLVEQ